MSILFINPTRRVELINFFNEYERVVIACNNELDPCMLIFKNTYLLDDEYTIEDLNRICEIENIKLIIPWLEKDILKILPLKSEINTKVMISNSEGAQICFDKLKSYNFLKENDFQSSPEIYANYDNIKFPLVRKPIVGSGSVGVSLINNNYELKGFDSDSEIIMRYYEGTEYSIDCFCDNGKMTNFVCRKRVKTRGGESLINIVEENLTLYQETKAICKALTLDGPVNIQYIYDNKLKNYFCIDINPRFSGGVIISILAGANYPKLVIDKYIYNKSEICEYPIRIGTIGSRYNKTYIK